MSVSVGPPTTSTPGVGTQPAQTPPPEIQGRAARGGSRRGLLILVLTLLVFAGAYALAWFNANRLATRFLADADAAYAAGNYLDALSGGETYDQERGEYVTQGGYVPVERIFSHRYSWPRGAQIARAESRIQEIIRERLTIEDAENFIRRNTGRSSVPYFGEVYLRLGELYEAEGAERDARDIYEEMARLFPTRPDLIEQAQAHLERLGAGEATN